MEGEALYGTIARYYDLLYHFKDYGKESCDLIDLIDTNMRSDGKKLLDIGCGTGGHLAHLRKRFDCTGMDLNEEMLEVAKGKMNDVRLIKGDMKNFDLEEKFNVIICMFGSIGYCRTLEVLQKAFENIYGNLEEEGIFIFEPWIAPSDFHSGQPFLDYYDGEGTKIARVTYSEKIGNLSRIEMHYLIGDQESGVHHFSDKHDMGLFTISETTSLLEKVGFTVNYDKKGIGGHQGIFLATRE